MVHKKKLLLLTCSIFALECIASTQTPQKKQKNIVRKGAAELEQEGREQMFSTIAAMGDFSSLSKEDLQKQIDKKTVARQKLIEKSSPSMDDERDIAEYDLEIKVLKAQLKAVEAQEAEAAAKRAEEEEQKRVAALRSQTAKKPTRKEERADLDLLYKTKQQQAQAKLESDAAEKELAALMAVLDEEDQERLTKEAEVARDKAEQHEMQVKAEEERKKQEKALAIEKQLQEQLRQDEAAALALKQQVNAAAAAAAAAGGEGEEGIIPTTEQEALDYFIGDLDIPGAKELIGKAFVMLGINPLDIYNMSDSKYSAYMKGIRNNPKNQTPQMQAAIVIIDEIVDDKEAPKNKDVANLSNEEFFEKYAKILGSSDQEDTEDQENTMVDDSSFLQTQIDIAQKLVTSGASQVSFADLAKLSPGVQVTPGFMGSVQVCMWNAMKNKPSVAVGNVQDIIDIVRHVRARA